MYTYPLKLHNHIFSSVIRQGLPFQNNLKDLDPLCKMDLDLWDCFGRGKTHFIAELLD